VLRDEITTIAEVLRGEGYATAHFGKWHLGDSSTVCRQGFDFNYGGFESGSPTRGGYHSPLNYPGVIVPDSGVYLTDVLTGKALEFMEDHRDRPFFVYLSHYAVHTPIQPPEDLFRKYRSETPGTLHHHPGYAAMVENMDRNFGRVLGKISELDLEENTIVIFYSDNGGMGQVTTMDPLRGAKGMIYEGGIRVPLAIFWPGTGRKGAEIHEPVLGTDLMPTLIEITGADTPDQVLDGSSIVPLLKGKGVAWEERPLFWHFPAYLQGYGNRPDRFRIRPCSAVRKGNYKLIHFYEDDRYELYDLGADLSETRDLAKEMPAITEELTALLDAWIEETGAPIPVEPNPDFDPEYYDWTMKNE
jgi:arylsulfatase A-like enzyme